MIDFGIKDIIDIILVALLLYYLYRVMKKSGTINIFVGILSIIGVWIVTSGIFEMKLTGTILDKFMNIGLIILVILFQDQIKRFLVDLGSQNKWRAIRRLIFRQEETSEENHADIMTIVYSCMNMAKTKTGALIVIQRKMPLSDYEKTGDEINANINIRLIENIFFKNSPLHDGAMIIAQHKITAAGCILPVSHDMNIPKSLGLRHRAALGMSQVTDALCIIVSEETGKISVAKDGELKVHVSAIDLENILSQSLT